MGLSEKKKDEIKRKRKGVKIRMVGNFFIALTLTKREVRIPIGIPIKKETNNKIPKIIV